MPRGDVHVLAVLALARAPPLNDSVTIVAL